MSTSRHEHVVSHLDLRSPYVVDTHELGRRPGASQRVARVVPAQAELGTEVIHVPEGSDLTLDLLLESVMEGVLVSGTATGQAAGECVRCLDALEQQVVVPLQELFAYPGTSSAGAEEVSQLIGDHLDLEPVVRDALVPALPFQPVCRPDCPGLCSQCGQRLADDPEHWHADLDSRWAALASFTEADQHSGPAAHPTERPDLHDDETDSRS